MMKKIIYLFLILSITYSCGNHEDVVFDPLTGQTLVSFDSSNSNLPVIIDSSGTLDILLSSTTLSSSERTINIMVDQDLSTANAENYSVPATAIIPANEYFATLTITGTDVSLDTTASTLVLKISGIDNGVFSESTHTVSLFIVCPIDAPFTGMYLIEQTTPYIDGATLSDGTVVEVTGSGSERSFMTANYPSYCTTPREFIFNLVCNEVIVPVQNSGCPCADGTDWFGPANGVNGTYDLTDDSVFYLTFADDTQEDCGPVTDTTYKFTKQ